VLGGSSSINGMIFQRGNPMDYQRWAADPGMASWDYSGQAVVITRKSRRPHGPQVVRIWTTELDESRSHEYEDFALSISLPMFRRHNGFIACSSPGPAPNGW
jgi:choline dehydrogenase-like flavoprotein